LLPSVQVFLNWLSLWRASGDFLSDVLSDGRRAEAIGLSRSPTFVEATAGKLADDAARRAHRVPAVATIPWATLHHCEIALCCGFAASVMCDQKIS